MSTNKLTPPPLDLSSLTFNFNIGESAQSQPPPPIEKKKRTPRANKKPVAEQEPITNGVIPGTFVINATEEPPEQLYDFTINEALFKAEELALIPMRDIFVRGSKVTNDELVKYFILKHCVIPYKCSAIDCPMKDNLWRKKACYLILHRKNGVQNDLSIANLSLICPNCFVQNNGIQLFTKFKATIQNMCEGCGYAIRKGSTLCYVCTQKIQKNGQMRTLTDYAELTARESFASTSNSSGAHAYTFTGLGVDMSEIDKEFAAAGISKLDSTAAKNEIAKIEEEIIKSKIEAYKEIEDISLNDVAIAHTMSSSGSNSKSTSITSRTYKTIPKQTINTNELNIEPTAALLALLDEI